jgi:hypothetical protein
MCQIIHDKQKTGLLLLFLILSSIGSSFAIDILQINTFMARNFLLLNRDQGSLRP